MKLTKCSWSKTQNLDNQNLLLKKQKILLVSLKTLQYLVIYFFILFLHACMYLSGT